MAANEFIIEGSGQNQIHAAISGLLDGHFATAVENTTTGDIQGSVSEIVRTTVGDAAADTFSGDSLHDVVFAGGGGDFINGGTGFDQLFGEAGNDTIAISQAQTVTGITYDGGADIDTLLVSGGGGYNYDLRDDVVSGFEALTYSDPGVNGTATVRLNASQFGAGLSLTATIDGVVFGDVADTLDVTMGSVTSLDLSGLTMLDFGGSLDKVVITGDSDPETIIGTSVRDVISTGAGSDTIDGGGGIDSMSGGTDNDNYIVDNAGDVVVENAGEGTLDLVRARVSYALAAGVDVELLQAFDTSSVAALNLTGNELVQTLLGNNGVNIIDGKGGADIDAGTWRATTPTSSTMPATSLSKAPATAPTTVCPPVSAML